MKRANFPRHAARRREEADQRQKQYSALSYTEKLARIEARRGESKERTQ
jgi:hypothetical protein